jgi:hypothetical protein
MLPESLKTDELQHVIALTTDAVSSICSVSDDCTARLDQIEEQIEETSGIEGVRVLRFRLEECLQSLREHSRHQKEEMSRLLAQLREQLEAAKAVKQPEHKDLLPAVDQLSGLELRERAEQALAPLWNGVGRLMLPCLWWTTCTSLTLSLGTRVAIGFFVHSAAT